MPVASSGAPKFEKSREIRKISTLTRNFCNFGTHKISTLSRKFLKSKNFDFSNSKFNSKNFELQLEKINFDLPNEKRPGPDAVLAALGELQDLGI